MDEKVGLPNRKTLPHSMPLWAPEASIYFVTICTMPRGENQLCKNELSESLLESVLDLEKSGRWIVHYFLLMPDHVHGLFSFNTKYGLKNTISSWKRYTALKFAIKWQRNFFDHRLRDDESLHRKIEYIAYNPVRKGLVQEVDDWPYAWYFR